MWNRTFSETDAVHGGRSGLGDLPAHVPPIDLSTTYPLPGVAAGGDSYETLATGGRPVNGESPVYQRLWNPTVARFEEALAALEGLPESVAFASGMAALTAVLLASVQEGRPHVVAVRPLYGGSDHLLASGLLGTEVTWAAPDGVAAALRPDTGLVLVETPANPDLRLCDLDRLRAAAGDVPVLVDNTFATPVLQQPARHGADLVLHSATKFLGGHGDALGGVVACGPRWGAALRRVRAITGGLVHPLAAYLLHRGLQTLHVRVRTAQDGARDLAARLAGHPAVTAVHYPGLPGADPAGLLGRQLAGPGAVLAFEVAGGGPMAAAVAGGCKLIAHAVSLGGVDTLIQHPASLTHRPVTGDAAPAAALLRLSVGLEDPADLWSDLVTALDGAVAVP
ncbi:cystathionine gamma-synthase [Pilimelia anulata]|uniref:homocysteine desulfhydrase n=1 Tax=Pilimelia anulata TaxID=53371 RepID=A0A8J3BC79_9ACTN|nr:PLP-dependent aspartate aminotransferase family protein [Pilimelia anulata]GGJ97313.1 cystathionine gamma-synthase [Pilimelia anulata]